MSAAQPCRLLVTPDGTVADRERPTLLADDLGALRGDGIFEAFLVVDGEPDLLEDHLHRLERSAEMMGLAPPPAAAWRTAVAAAISAWSDPGEIVVRLVVTRGPEHGDDPTAYLLADPLSPVVGAQRRTGISVLTLARGLDPSLAQSAPWLLMGAKTLSYAVNMAALRWARAHDADDVVFVAGDGTVLEGPTSAVVAARGERLSSPPASLGILASLSLEGLFARAPAEGWQVAREPLTVDDLRAADGVWLVSSVRLAARVRILDGLPLPSGDLRAPVASLVGPPAAGR